MAKTIYQRERVVRVVVDHRENNGLYGRLARLVVWVVMASGRKVWLKTIEGGLDGMLIERKEAVATDFFTRAMVGRSVKYSVVRRREEVCFFAVQAELLEALLRVRYADLRG